MTIQRIISNPKYQGYYVGRKYQTIDYSSKKQMLLPSEEWVVFKDKTGNTVPAIVDEDLWEKANEVLAQRKDYMKNRRGVYSTGNLFTKKLICTHCGTPYHLHPYRKKDGSKRNIWTCYNMIENGTAACPSFILYEEELIPLIIGVFSGQDTPVENKHDLKKELNTIEEYIHAIEAKKQNNLTDNACGRLCDSEFLERNNHLNHELRKLDAQRNALVKQNGNAKERSRTLSEMHSAFKQVGSLGGNTNSLNHLVTEFIDRIFITANDDGESITLDLRLITGDTYRHVMKMPKNRKLKKKNLEPPLGTGHSNSNEIGQSDKQ